jgi:hypothetical protein
MAILSRFKELIFIGLITGMTFCPSVSEAEEINGKIANYSKEIIREFSQWNRKSEIRPYTSYIIWHTTGASDNSSLNSTREDGSAHYLITTDGKLHSIVLDDKVANHAGESMWNGDNQLNYYSVGVEIVGYPDEEINPEQYFSSMALNKYLKEKYKIDDENVLVHAAVAYGGPYKWSALPVRGRKIDGINIDMKRLGVLKRPLYDPDVREKRLVAHPDLERALYPLQNKFSHKKDKSIKDKFLRKSIKVARNFR